MGKIVIKCPHCGYQAKAKMDSIGRKTKCPQCERVFVIGWENQPRPPETAGPRPQPVEMAPWERERRQREILALAERQREDAGQEAAAGSADQQPESPVLPEAPSSQSIPALIAGLLALALSLVHIFVSRHFGLPIAVLLFSGAGFVLSYRGKCVQEIALNAFGMGAAASQLLVILASWLDP